MVVYISTADHHPTAVASAAFPVAAAGIGSDALAVVVAVAAGIALGS